jgi:hypothetical protein
MDKQLNDDALRDGGRLVSVYVLSTGVMLWVITESGSLADHDQVAR